MLATIGPRCVSNFLAAFRDPWPGRKSAPLFVDFLSFPFEQFLGAL